MKSTSTLILLLLSLSSFSQWTRVQQLPASDIFSLYKDNNALYAGGKNLVYISHDQGQTWDSTTAITQIPRVDNLIVYRNELYVSCYSIGVFKTSNNGITWQNVSNGIFPFVSDLAEWNGGLYAATLGDGVYKLDPVHLDNWTSFNTGLSSLSVNLNSITGNSHSLIAGTNNNGLYDLLPAVNSTIWNELFLLGQVSPNEGVFDIITAHDSLVLAGHTGAFYLSIDDGLNWNKFGNNLSFATTFNSLLNTKQAFLVARNIFDGFTDNSFYYYIKKDSLQGNFKQFSAVTDHFSYKLETFGNKLWDASSKGLFFMSLSDLPGITASDDTVVATPLPVRFISFTLQCGDHKIVVNWKTASEQNVSHYNVEESADGIHWSVIDVESNVGTGSTESNYVFSESNPTTNNLYRIAEIDIDGRIHYSDVLRTGCSWTDRLNIFPNPTTDKVFVDVTSSKTSKATIKIFDSKGALVKEQSTELIQGNNHVPVEMRSFADGMYEFIVSWNSEQNRKIVQILKQ